MAQTASAGLPAAVTDNAGRVFVLPTSQLTVPRRRHGSSSTGTRPSRNPAAATTAGFVVYESRISRVLP
jgi:hypothetical protein